MAKSRPGGGRPPNRRGRGGIGPGPGYRPNPNTGGTKHGGGMCMLGRIIGAAILAYLAVAALAIGGAL